MSGETLEWSERFSVGVAALDEDHKRLVSVIDKLFTAHSAGTVAGKVGAILDELITYTDQHFAHEEGLLRERGYPGLHDHEIAHRRLVTSILKVRLDWNDGESEATILKLAELLKTWLVEHIVGMDRQYQTFLNEHGVA